MRAAGALAALLAGLAVGAPAPPPAAAGAGPRLYGFECGRIDQPDLGRFNDAMRFAGERRTLAAGCFVVRHPRGVLLWDTGVSAAMAAGSRGAVTLGEPIVRRLAAIGLSAEAVTHVGISHHHADHTGGADAFAAAELLIGREDWAAIAAMPADALTRRHLAPWLKPGAKVRPVSGDLDVFGDGSVTMLAMPGHTPGHRALLVRLRRGGAVLISGDQYHFRENRAVRGVPTFNTDRADTLASHDRFETIAQVTGARVVIQHDPRDLAALGAYPEGID